MYEREESKYAVFFGNIITVNKPETANDGITIYPPAILWSSIGPTEIDQAKEFHTALGLAIQEAEKLNEAQNV